MEHENCSTNDELLYRLIVNEVARKLTDWRVCLEEIKRSKYEQDKLLSEIETLEKELTSAEEWVACALAGITSNNNDTYFYITVAPPWLSSCTCNLVIGKSKELAEWTMFVFSTERVGRLREAISAAKSKLAGGQSCWPSIPPRRSHR